jgi:hypothetical protein
MITSENLIKLEKQTHIAKDHIERISNYSKKNNVLLAIRDLNPAIPDKISEISKDQYVGKDLHVKFKSAMIPEIAGYIPVENRFSKKKDPLADAKMEAILLEENTNYKAVNVTKIVTENNEETNFTLCYDSNKEENNFYYRNENNGKYYSAIKDSQEIDASEMQIKEVKVLGDVKGRVLIPDYDLAVIGNTVNNQGSDLQTHAMLHDDYGRVPTAHKDLIEDLQDNVTDQMVRHGSDNYNPVAYQFEMSQDAPYSCFLPNGDVQVASNPKEYLDIVNNWRDPERNPMKQSYDLVLNPRLGVEVDAKGDFYLPEKRFNWEELDNNIRKMEADVKKLDPNSKGYKVGMEKLQDNKDIVNQYEKVKRIEMQEVYFKNGQDYDGWKESLKAAKDTLDDMKSGYEKIYKNEKPLISDKVSNESAGRKSSMNNLLDKVKNVFKGANKEGLSSSKGDDKGFDDQDKSFVSRLKNEGMNSERGK